MKIVIDRAALLKPLGHVQSVVERRNTIPILSNVLLKAADGRLSLSTTDMDMDIVESVACDVSEAGIVTVPAHTLYDIVRKLPDGSDVELAASGDVSRVTIRAGRSNFSLPALMPEEFPALSGDALPHSFVISAADACMLIDRTRFAISTEETRYYLNGIFLHAADADGVKVLRAVATDGHRLARVQMPLPEGAAEMPGVIVPRKAVNEVRKLIDGADGDVTISLSDTKLRVSFEDTVVTTKLIDGTFPDYERVIPSGNDKMLHVDRQRFSEAVDRVATISTEKSRSVKLAVTSGQLTLSASSPDNGTAQEEVEVDYSASDIEIGFNSKYLLDITGQIEGERAVFQLADQASPTIILDQDDESALYVLMPMRV
ncbi:DNA polymerase III subunit beta [Nisaea nitritireducens]|uniref:DNA polymerase III subunit beta n=1 Tax=Nisaea nitritireducens TaxID=568392 RepID=UPI001867E924|nr:DNA polymerase III subunit beta [Nisaea nitritireducens]